MAVDPASLIEGIYEAAFLPDGWAHVLDRLARSVGGEGAVLSNAREPAVRYRTSDGIRELIDRIVEDGWMTRQNHRIEGLMKLQPYHGFANEAEHFTEAECDAYPVYTELMRPHGYGFGAATVIAAPSGDNMVFSIERRASSQPFGQREIAFLDGLRPHLARASLMASRLEFERLNAAMQALEMTGLPSAVLTDEGRVLAANASFQDYKADLDIGPGDRLVLLRPAAARRLAAALAALREPASRAGASFALPARDDSPPAVIHLVPIEGGARDLFARAACFLVVTPIDRGRVPDADVIQGLFDLTRAEARVAQRLGGGEDVMRIAATLGLSPETIRTQVKAILSKSGLSRQIDFVATITSIRPLGKPPR